jgi:hypothetical protein
MKSRFKVLFGLSIVLGFMIGVAHADTGAASAPSTIQLPSWIVAAIKDLENIPAIGHVITSILGVIAIGSMILTPLTAFLMAVEKALNLTGLLPAINFLNAKVIPIVSYVSNFNSQLASTPAPTTTTVASTPSTPASGS